jgi:hypothetical protein
MVCGKTKQECLECSKLCKHDKYNKNSLELQSQLRDIAEECKHNSMAGTARKFKVSRDMVRRALYYYGDKGVNSVV